MSHHVDDIALAASRYKINEFFNTTFNSLHPRLQFTLEIGDNKLNFLNVTLINNKEKVEFDWYKKPTFSGRILNFFKLYCKNFDATYVGQTKRKLNTRILDHRKDINKKTGKHSIITKHRINNNRI